jgi:hypothetical protein
MFKRAIDCSPEWTLCDAICTPEVRHAPSESDFLRRPPFLQKWLKPSEIRRDQRYDYQQMRRIGRYLRNGVFANGSGYLARGENGHGSGQLEFGSQGLLDEIENIAPPAARRRKNDVTAI